MTPRTIQHYELGTRKPTKLDIVEKLAKALNTTPEYLLGQNGLLVVAAHEQGGSKAARDIDELVSEVTGMFAGGRLSESVERCLLDRQSEKQEIHSEEIP